MRRIWILNLSLVAVLAAITVRLYEEWIMFDATHQTGAVEPERETFAKLPFGVPPNPPAPANWPIFHRTILSASIVRILQYSNPRPLLLRRRQKLR